MISCDEWFAVLMGLGDVSHTKCMRICITFGCCEFVWANDVKNFVVGVLFGWWGVFQGTGLVAFLAIRGLVPNFYCLTLLLLFYWFIICHRGKKSFRVFCLNIFSSWGICLKNVFKLLKIINIFLKLFSSSGIKRWCQLFLFKQINNLKTQNI